MKTDVISFVEKKQLWGVNISHPIIFSANKHFETLLFLKGVPKVMSIMFRGCHNHTGRVYPFKDGLCTKAGFLLLTAVTLSALTAAAQTVATLMQGLGMFVLSFTQ